MSNSLMKVAQKDGNRRLAKLIINYLDRQIVRPSLKAFVFAHLYVTLPKIFNVIVANMRKKKYGEIWPKVMKIAMKATHPEKFPMFAACLIGGINVLEPLIYQFLKKYGVSRNPVNNIFVTTLAASFLSSLMTFPRYQNHILGYGRYYSLDLTLLVTTRACDSALSSVLGKIVPPGINKYGDAGLFVVSSAFIMYSWFYNPERLPPAYRKWITSAANMDDDLVYALKGLHDGTLKYGGDQKSHEFLGEYCKRHGEDPKRGSLVLNQPLECDVVHAFKTSNCELHALWRFVRGFFFAFKIYGTINAIMLLFPRKGATFRSRLQRALTSSVRSSTFLGIFITICWYSVCLARKRLFPKLMPNKPMTYWDKTVGPTTGSVLCGLSSLVETQSRRKELALFVAPRALGTIVPSDASYYNLKIEGLIFSISTAVLVAYSKSDPKKVRGIFGKGLQQVFNLGYYV